eukprot:10529561-Prorocentrum_lima.AAC.1
MHCEYTVITATQRALIALPGERLGRGIPAINRSINVEEPLNLEPAQHDLTMIPSNMTWNM